jgi:type IV pilus assembly protein PilC
MNKHMQINTADLIKRSDRGHKSDNFSKNFFSREISLPSLGNKNQLKARFFSESAILLKSGMDLKKTLEIIFEGICREKEKRALKIVMDGLIKGQSLSMALHNSGDFSLHDTVSVKIGEESGTLPMIMEELSSYYLKRIFQQRQIRAALTYPVLVLLTTVFSLTFMLTFIVPMFKDVFLRFNGNLPLITQAIIKLSESFPKYFLILSISISVLIASGLAYKKKEWYRKFSTALALKVPVFGSIIKLTYKVRYCQNLKLLLSAKVNLQESIDLIKQMITFYPLEIALTDVRKNLGKGMSLSQSMESHDIFDKKMVSMTKVAEEVNKLDVIYEKLYQQYSDELDIRIKTMNNLLEPVLIVFVGGLVAVILVSMYLPIFQIGSGITY